MDENNQGEDHGDPPFGCCCVFDNGRSLTSVQQRFAFRWFFRFSYCSGGVCRESVIVCACCREREGTAVFKVRGKVC